MTTAAEPLFKVPASVAGVRERAQALLVTSAERIACSEAALAYAAAVLGLPDPWPAPPAEIARRFQVEPSPGLAASA